MNIKNVVKSQSLRHWLLRFFFWIPDNIMLPFQYYLILKRWPDMRNPRRFTEKFNAISLNIIIQKC